MHLLLLLTFYLPLVLCDTIKINSPTRNQVINNSSFLIDYLIERNNNNSQLFVSNATTELLDVRGNSLVSVPRNFTNSTMVRLDMRTFVQSNTVTNFTVKITAFGKFANQTFGEIEAEIPLQLNLSNKTETTTTTSTTSTSTSQTTTTEPSSSNSSETANPTASETTKSNGSYITSPSLMSFILLFFI